VPFIDHTTVHQLQSSYFTSMIELHGQWGPRLRRLVSRGWTWLPGCSSGPPSILLGSHVFLALRWMTPEMVVGNVVAWHRLYLAAQPSHMAGDVDGLSCPLHHPTDYSHQTRGQIFLPGVALSHHAAVGGGTFLGGAKPPGLDI
jgi:hypothetical protein